MRSDAFRGTLALRVDVDFPLGLSRAVPRFLDGLAAAGMHATFFVVTGTNPASMARLLRPDYLRRLARLGPSRILTHVILPSLGDSGEFLGSDERRRIVRRIVTEGHELAVHGHDHAWWADHVWQADADRIADEIERGFTAIESLGDIAADAWGSPSWRTNDTVLRELERRGVPYLADCWGWEPFQTLDRCGEPIGPAHLPITLPSLESLMLTERVGVTEAIERVLEGRPDDRFDQLCLHDYFEGLLHPSLFDRLLDTLQSMGIATTTLGDAARRIDGLGVDLPCRALERAPVPGFSGAVSWQGR